MKKILISRISGAAAIIEKNKILLTKRTSMLPVFPNLWTFPAGRIEATDLSIENCVIREVKEEVGLDFKPTSKLNFYESFVNENKRNIGLVFLGEWKGKIKLQESEVSDAKFFSYKEAKNLDIAFAYKQVINDLHKLNLLKN